MKKSFVLSGIIALTTIICGCGNQDEQPKSTAQTAVTSDAAVTTAQTTKATTTTKKVTKATTTATMPTTEPPISIDSDDTATVTQNSDGSFNVDFSYGCSMIFPSSWAGRVEIKDNTVHSTIMQEEGKLYDGKLFSVKCFEENPRLVGNERMLLGVSDKGYLIATVPQDIRYDMNNDKMHQEYLSLSADYEAIWSTAVCNKSSADFSPILLSGYSNPDYVDDSLLLGTWEAVTDTWTEESVMDIGCIQSSPYLVFCSDGTLAYQCFNESETGTYIINTFNDSDIYALGFIDGRIQIISMYHLNLMVGGMPEIQYQAADESMHNTTDWGFIYHSDSQMYGNDPWFD